jgi:uncharacterized membrane protein
MSTATASRPWPAPAANGKGAVMAWRFARALDGGAIGLQWVLKRNCSITPTQLFGTYLALCAVSLTIALGFTWNGASPVLAFAAIELLLVGVALLVYARHAADQERITLADGALRVEHQRGPQTERTEFRAAWVRVEPRHGEGSLVELSGDGQQTFVGRYLRPEMRTPLAQELRVALRASRDLMPVSDAESKFPSNQESK